MRQYFGDGSEGGDGNRGVDLQPIEHLHQVFVAVYGHTIVLGDRDDLGGDRTSPFGENPWEVIAISVIAQRNSGFWIFGHHPILSCIEAVDHASPFVIIVVTLRKR